MTSLARASHPSTLKRLALEGRTKPSLGTFYGPHRDDFARAAGQAVSVREADAARLERHPTGPFVVPGGLDDDTRWALARAEMPRDPPPRDRPGGLRPGPQLVRLPPDRRGTVAYLVSALEAKIVTIGTGDHLDPARIADLERRWHAIFEGSLDE